MDGAVLHSKEQILQRLDILIKKGVIISYRGDELSLRLIVCVYMEIIKRLWNWYPNLSRG